MKGYKQVISERHAGSKAGAAGREPCLLLGLRGDPDHLGGAELSEHRCDIAAAIRRGVAAIHCDIAALPNDGKRWDVVMARAVWMHLPGLGSPPAAQQRMALA